MWLLVSKSQPELRHPILGDHKYVVGRQNCDIVIADASVSRKQAVLTMAHYETNVVKSHITPTLTLEDISKFGTFVNGKAVQNPGGNTITLKHDDEIKFGGTPASIFKARYEPFVATTSCLEKGPKKSLHKVMCLLGGHLVRDWRPTCDLLIMSKINVTIKVICAINKQKHIVTPQYLDNLYAHLMGKAEKPDPVNYLPEVVDQEVPQGVSFHPDIRRATLLQGIKFYFLSAVQFNKTNLAVSTAGGQPILLEDGTEEEAETMTEDGTVVVAVSRDVLASLNPSCQKFFRLVSSVLRRHNLRMVTDPEIGWAILTCNTEDFCNPRSSLTPGMLSTMASQSLSQVVEVDASQIARLTEIKTEKRPFESVQEPHETSSSDDSKPLTKKLKVEKSSPASDSVQVVAEQIKIEPSSGQTRTEEIHSDVISIDMPASDEKIKPEIFSSPPTPAAASGKSVAQDRASASDDDNSRTSGEGISDKILPQHAVSNSKKDKPRSEEMDDPSEAISVFARQKATKRTAKTALGNFEDSDDDIEVSLRKRPAVKKSALFDDDDDSGGDDSVGRNIGKRVKKGPGALFLSDEEDSLPTTEQVSSKKDKSHADESIREHENTSRSEKRNSAFITDTDNGERGEKEAARLPAISGDGWVDMTKLKTRREAEKSTGMNGVENSEMKPDTELLLDKDGKLLRNLCDIQTTELVARQPQSTSRQARQSEDQQATGMKNFKKFRKTQHVGAGKLPTIIGGRDLEVYLGNKHKDIEDLFSVGMAQENERQEEERRGKDLFDWDDRSRKGPVAKRTR